MYYGQTRPMVVYDRKIRYLDFMEGGERSGGAGFVKLERRDEHCCISLQVSGLYRKDRFTRPLYLLDGETEYELCRIQLSEGGVKLYLENLVATSLDGRGLKYENVIGLRIPISEGKEIKCLWGQEAFLKEDKGKCIEDEDENKDMTGEERGDMNGEVYGEVYGDMNGYMTGEQSGKETVGKIADGKPDERNDRDIVSEIAEGKNDEIMERKVEEKTREKTGGEREEEMGNGNDESAVLPLRERKWDQLWEIYPHKVPFGDSREYLALGPGDLVLLSAKSYARTNNSFLFHGYFHYRHLILTRMSDRGRVLFYIGVPGNFYERDRRSAVMFGFESFECAKEPAEEGSFGYYMMPVEI